MKNDINDCISQCNNTNIINTAGYNSSQQQSVDRYDEQGNETEQDSLAVAKRVNNARGSTCYVRVNQNNVLFNPYDDHYIQDTLKVSNRMAVDPYKLSKCSEDCVSNFLYYLKTRDRKYYELAQRGIG